MTRITFQKSSKLKRIGERAFANTQLSLLTIPASAEKIEGSAFIGCPVLVIRIEPGSENFKVDGNFLLTSDGIELVRYFGRELEVVVPKKVEILRRSCFEECNQVETVLFENDSYLRIIGHSALSNCSSLRNISIPASVEIIEEPAFKQCTGLESCIIAENANVARIEKEAFSIVFC
jgi:hypothetical protein